MLPTYPTNLIPRPFANNGTFQVIPDAKTSEGRASWQEGFPVETQLPLSQGGIAPSRPDFNGILNMLSALAFWQQSGGQWIYKTELDYNTPAIVFHNGVLWWCKAPNGPSQTIGTVTPGTNTDYWITLLDFLTGVTTGGGASVGNPVGTIIMFHGTTAPTGYLACNGASFSATMYPKLYALLGATTLPDYSGLVPRGYDPSKKHDPDGATRTIGSIQQDAMQPITGAIDSRSSVVNIQVFGELYPDSTSVSGAFDALTGPQHIIGDASKTQNAIRGFSFNSAKVTRTASETRMKNISVLFCIKHD